MSEPSNPWGEPPAANPYQPPPPLPHAPPPGWGQPQYPQQHSAPPPYGQPYPPQYQPPYGQWGAIAPQHTNGLAIASMVLGILWIYWVGSLLALIFGYIAKKQIRERNEGGSGMATAGIVLGWIGIGFFALFSVFGVLAVLSGA